MSNKICPECRTENEPEYIYCKNCGADLSAKDANSQPFSAGYETVENQTYGEYREENNYSYSQDYSQNGYNQNNYNGFTVESFDSIPAQDVANFVGKKSSSILPKFSKMEITQSKVSWCWPVAVLSFFFGPIGAALWFFYRKMYKAAIILLAVGLIFSGVTSYFLSNAQETENLPEIPSITTESQDDTVNFNEIFESILSNRDFEKLSLLNNAQNIITLVITGMFSMYWYKKHVVKKISVYRMSNVDPRYYQMGLMSLGGTSGGMVCLGIVIWIFATNVVDILLKFI